MYVENLSEGRILPIVKLSTQANKVCEINKFWSKLVTILVNPSFLEIALVLSVSRKVDFFCIYF
ncbi:hypothetical protein COC69_12455 [Bacillus cereus]|uniref:Uncharacterized protein n=1 Tax=Bacillus cereus TaxID=1396 RepID=A0A9X7CNN8_BACCE|nr:hypothetical protein COC69_12455 [Bacillus cereus]